MSYEQKDPRLLEEVGDLSLWLFKNQIGLLYIAAFQVENEILSHSF